MLSCHSCVTEPSLHNHVWLKAESNQTESPLQRSSTFSPSSVGGDGHAKRSVTRHQTSKPAPLLPCSSLSICTPPDMGSSSVTKVYGHYDSSAVVQNKNCCYEQQHIKHYYHLLNQKKNTKPNLELV